MTKLPEYANISGILSQKSAFEQQQQRDKERADDIKKRIKTL